MKVPSKNSDRTQEVPDLPQCDSPINIDVSGRSGSCFWLSDIEIQLSKEYILSTVQGSDMRDDIKYSSERLVPWSSPGVSFTRCWVKKWKAVVCEESEAQEKTSEESEDLKAENYK